MDQRVRGAGGRRHAAVRVRRPVRRAAVPGLLRRAQEEYPLIAPAGQAKLETARLACTLAP